jgi:large repetitive protein
MGSLVVTASTHPSLMSTEFKVNTFTTDDQGTYVASPVFTPASQSVGVDKNGNFVIAWSSRLQDGSGFGVYAQRFAANGATLGSEFRVNTFTSDDQLMPSVSMADDTGEFVITWSSYQQSGDFQYGVYGQRYSAAGAAVDGEFRVNTTTFGNQQFSSVAMDADGDFVVTWTSDNKDGNGTAVVMRRYDKANDKWGSEFVVNQTTSGDQTNSSIAMESNGDFVITWTNTSPGTDVYARRFNADGTAIGGEFRVNTFTGNTQNESSVAMDADGDFVVAWTSNGQDGSSYGVYAQRYDLAGNPVGSEFKVNTYVTNQQRNPQVAMDANGGFVITWSGNSQDLGTTWGIFGQRYDANGIAKGGEFSVNETTSGDQRFSTVGMDADGDFIAAWTSSGQDGSGYGVYAKQFAGIPNNAPTVSNVNKAAIEDVTLTFAATDFTTAFTDPDGGNLSRIKIASLPAKGILKLNGIDVTLNQDIGAADIGNLVYVPIADYNGTDSFLWNGSDGISFAGNNAIVSLAIASVNDIPTVNTLNKTIDEDSPAAFAFSDFAGVFSDVDNDLLNKIKITALPTTGILRLNGTPVVVDQEIAGAQIGNLTFTPAPNFSGTVTFEWNGSDGTAYADAPAIVNLTVTAINDLPAISAITKTVTEDTAVIFASGDFTGAYSDADSDPLNKIIITFLPTNGTLTLSGAPVAVNQEILPADLGNLQYTPTLNFNGTDVFGWNGSDGTGYALTATTVSLNITAVNNAPTVTNVSKAGTEDTVVTFAASDFSAQFADVDGNSLSEIQITSLPTGGTLRLGGIDVVAGQKISASNLSNLTFTPNANVNGIVSFGWNGSDGALYAGLAAAVDLTLAPVNDPPTVISINKTGVEDNAIAFSLSDFTTAFSDIDNDGLNKIKITSLPTNGVLQVNGSVVAQDQEISATDLNSLIFIPNANANGTITFDWNGSDGTTYAATGATVSMAIASVNDVPAVNPVSKTSVEDATLGFSLNDFANAFSDPDGTALAKIQITALPTSGTLRLNGTDVALNQEIAAADINNLLFFPATNFNGTVTFGWNGSDGTSYAAIASTVSLGLAPVNDQPTLINVTKIGSENTPVNFQFADFAAAFSDVDGDNLTKIQVNSLPANGSLTLNGTPVTAGQEISAADLNNLVFTPVTSFNGNVSFNWNGFDGFVYAASGAIANIDIGGVNDPPVVTNIAKSGSEDTVVTFAASDFTAAFSDLDGNNLNRIQITSLPTNGVLKLAGVDVTVGQEIVASALGNLTFTPNADFNGSVSFAWNGFDGTVYAVTPAAVNMTVNPVNDAPTVIAVNKSGTEDVAIVFAAADFTTAFSDPDGNPLSKIQITSLPTSGALQLNGVNVTLNQEIDAVNLSNLAFVPAANANGAVSFTWNGSDGTAYATTGATVNLSFAAVNDVPTVGTVSKTTSENAAIAFSAADFTASYSDVENDPLSKIQITSLPTSGTLSLGVVPVTIGQEIVVAALSTLSFTPTTGFNGSLSFGWTGSDGSAYATTAGTVNLTVTPVNEAPTIGNISKTGVEDGGAIAFVLADFTNVFSDGDGDSLNKIQITSLPSNGILSLNGVEVTTGQEIPVAQISSLTFTPSANFNGSASFSWNGSDGVTYATSTGSVNVTISAVNDLPTLGPVSRTSTEDVAIAFAAGDFLAAFTDADGDAPVQVRITSLPSSGVLALGGTPVTVNQDIPLSLLNTLTFTPASTFNGTVSFGWNASDGTGFAPIDGAVNLTFTPVNNTPAVGTVNKSGAEDGAIAFTLADFGNAFSDVDNDPLAKIEITSLPSNGTLLLSGVAVTVNQEITAANLANLTFTPTANFNGNVSFGWNGSDGITYAATPGTVNLTITPLNDPPTVGTIGKTSAEDAVVTFTATDFTNAFSDVDGNSLSKIQITALPANGTLSLGGTPVTLNQEISAAALSTLTFTPAANFNGSVSFGWNASDGLAYAATSSTVNLTITPVNNAPTVGTITKSGVEDGGAIAFTASDFTTAYSDIETDPLTKIQITSLPTGGTLLLGGAPVVANQDILLGQLGSLSFTPAANVNGTVSFGWTASDGSLYAVTSGTININLAPVNDLPSVSTVSKTTAEDAAIAFTAADFSTAFTDVDGDSLTKIQITSLPTSGTLSLGGTPITVNQEIPVGALSTLTFTPAPTFNGNLSFGWNGADATGYAIAAGTVNLTVTPVNNAPTVGTITKSGVEDSGAIAFTAADFTNAYSDVENDPLATVQITSLPANGTLLLGGVAVTLNQEIPLAQLGTLSFAPTANFNGNVSIGWNGSDGTAYAAASGTIAITITAVNDTPTISPVSKTGTEDGGAIAFTAADFTAAFSDPDGTSLSKIQITSLPSSGTLRLSGAAVTLNQEILVTALDTLTFTPNANVNGTVSFGWNGSDGTGYATAASTVNVAIAPVNDLPSIGNISKTGSENGVITFAASDFTAAFSDVDGDSLAKIQIASLPSSGSLQLSGAAVTVGQEVLAAQLGNLTFTPAPDFNGSLSFNWTGSDSTGYPPAGGTVNLTLTPVNSVPTVGAVSKTGNEDVAIAFAISDFSTAFSDPDGDGLNKIRISSLPANGTLLLNGAAVTVNQEIPAASLGNLTFTPSANFNGSTSFSWNGSDGTLYANTGSTVALTISAVNDAPNVGTITKTGVEDGAAIAFTASDFTNAYSDVDNNPLTKIQIASLPAGGTLQLSGVNVTLNQEISVANLGNLTFVPNANANGTLSFSWNGSDGTSYAVTAGVVNLTITPVNDTPSIGTVSKTIAEDTVITFTASDFGAVFADIDNDPLAKIQITTLPANGTLSLGGTVVTAGQEIMAAVLNTLTFTPVANFNGSTSFGWNGSDGTVYAAAAGAVNLTVTAVNDAPMVSAVSKTGTEDAGAIAFTSADFTSAFSDAEGSGLAKIQITSLPPGGTLSLSGVAVTVGQEIAAANLGNLLFTPNANVNGTITFGWNGSDGTTYATAASTVSMAIAPVNDAPTVSPIAKTGTEDSPIAFTTADFSAAFSDVDGNSLNKIQITSLPTNGTLLLGGAAVTLNQEIAAAALNSLTFAPTANVNGSASFTWNGSDGMTYAVSGSSVNLTVNAVNDAPTVGNISKTGAEDSIIAFTATDFASAFNDVDGNSLTKIQITSLPTNGTLRLNGTAVTLNQEIAVGALGNLVFIPTANANGSTSFGWNGSDGTAYAAASGSVGLTITAVNDAPAVATTATPLLYTEGNGAIAIDSGLTLADVDSTQFTGATVSITNFDATQDSLGFANQNGISGSITGGTLTLSGTASLANYLTALRSVTYTNGSISPNTTTRTVQFSLRDDSNAVSNLASRNIQITAVDSPPSITPTPGALSYLENSGAATIDSGISLNDIDSQLLTQATVSILGYDPNGKESLSLSPQNGITASFNTGTGVLTLIGLSAVANYQTALRSVKYTNNSDQPPASRTIQFSISDSTSNSTPITRQIQITPVNDAPTALTTRGVIPYARQMGTITLDDTILVSDADNTTLTGAVVAIANYGLGQGILGFTNQNGITGSFNSTTGVLSLTGTASPSVYQAALRTVTYTHGTAIPTQSPQLIQFSVQDGASTSDSTSSTLQVVFNNTAPQLDLNGTAAGIDYATAGLSGVAIAAAPPSLSLVDPDGFDLASATVAITNPLPWTQEQLAVNTAGTPISASYNPNLGVLSLVGNATADVYQQVLRTVTYSSALVDPTASTRSLSFVVNDGRDNSAIATTTVSLTPNPAISGNGLNPTLVTTPFRDVINAPGTNDTIASTLTNLHQNDIVDGGGGIDTLILADGTGSAVVNVSDRTNQVSGIIPSSTSVMNCERFDFRGFKGSSRMTGSNTLNDYLIGGAGNDVIVGNGGHDVLWGNEGSDRILGGIGKDALCGGKGRDRLTGSRGRDDFMFTNRRDGVDVITDFRRIDDHIVVSRAGFSRNLKLGRLRVGQFTLGSRATEASHRFIYNRNTGNLFFDADGTGSAKQIQIAHLDNQASLTRREIIVIA